MGIISHYNLVTRSRSLQFFTHSRHYQCSVQIPSDPIYHFLRPIPWLLCTVVSNTLVSVTLFRECAWAAGCSHLANRSRSAGLEISLLLWSSRQHLATQGPVNNWVLHVNPLPNLDKPLGCIYALGLSCRDSL